MAPKKTTKKKTTNNTVSLWQGLSVLLLAILIGNISGGKFFPNSAGGALFSKTEISEGVAVKLGTGDEFMVHEGKTWIPVDGTPVELIVLNDKTCGIGCDPTKVANSLRQGITPALLVRNVDVATEEGKKLAENFNIKGVPSFILGDGFSELETDGEKYYDKVKEILIEKDGLYLIDSGKTGFKHGKFLVDPDFEIVGEPTLGDGTVTVVEFTDLQCPYCKRLHDQNKQIIEQFVKEGKIKYVQKDFPLSFHKEATVVHAVGNCIASKDGNDKFFAYRNLVFDNQAEWSGQANAETLAIGYAREVGATTDGLAACANSAGVLAEITEDVELGSRYGVSGTPALFIGTQIMPGAIGSAAFVGAVTTELNK